MVCAMPAAIKCVRNVSKRQFEAYIFEQEPKGPAKDGAESVELKVKFSQRGRTTTKIPRVEVLYNLTRSFVTREI